MLCQFLPLVDMSQPQVYIYPLPLEPPSHLPPHLTPLGCHRAPGLSFLDHTTNSHWLSILHMVMYMFQCYSLNLSLLLLPTLCSQVSSLCLHLHCCLPNRFIGTFFLDSIVMRCCCCSVAKLCPTICDAMAYQSSLSFTLSQSCSNSYPLSW